MRKRSRANNDLTGTNIRTTKVRTTRYYYYIMPDGSQEPLGTNRQQAIEAAIILNQHLRPSGDIADKILAGHSKPQARRKAIDNVGKLCDEYWSLVVEKSKNSDRTKDEKRYKLNRYRDIWGDRSSGALSVRDISEFLNTLTDHAYIKHRGLLIDLLSFAIHQGYRDDNPAMLTRKKAEPDRVRKRHTIEGFKKIRAIAPDWMQRTMDIALLSLQREGDLSALRKDQVNLDKNTIRIMQRKSANYREPVYIEIAMGKELRKAVEACFNTGINCPYLIHTRPKRITQKIREAKAHVFAVTEDHISKTFTESRDKSETYAHLPPEERPTFHSLRALGIWLYEQAGFTDEYISALSGHATDAMLARYKEGHAAPDPVSVAAELSISEEK